MAEMLGFIGGWDFGGVVAGLLDGQRFTSQKPEARSKGATKGVDFLTKWTASDRHGLVRQEIMMRIRDSADQMQMLVFL